MPRRFYLTCARCRARPATNGHLCIACVMRQHAWDGNALRSVCRVCGCVRYKKRKRTWPGQEGSRWQTWYDIDPAFSDEKPNPPPACR